jgi:PTS system nitrogen regulatory IIA component
MTAIFQITSNAVAFTSAGTKNEILIQLANRFALAYGLDPDCVLEHLEEREKLGSTGFGRGVAIPHARIAEIRRPVAAMLKLEEPADFASSDGMPVDLVFGLLSPENAGATHLHALAAISRMVREEGMHEAMTEAPDAEALFALVSNVSARDAA